LCIPRRFGAQCRPLALSPAAAFGTPGITTPGHFAVAVEMSVIIGRLHEVFDDGKELH